MLHRKAAAAPGLRPATHHHIYDAPSPEAVRQVAERNQLPVDRITQVSVLDPYTYGT